VDKFEAVTLARKLIDDHGLPGWDFKLNKTKRQLGVCKEPIKRIEMSEYYVLHNRREMIVDTILHEIAHALVGVNHGHDQVWKHMCLRLGCNPKSCDKAVQMPEGDWRAQCPSCKRVFSRHRRPKSLRGFFCTRCGPALGQLCYSNVKVSYERRREKAASGEARQLMLKIF
jgi:predicted SprT family Zn-dependent metalloprotease